MAPGPHVFGDGRLGVWFIWHSVGFTDKLKHRLPLVKALGVTDAFLPRQASLSDKKLVQSAGLFAALYETPPAGKAAQQYAALAVSDTEWLKMGALELNIEGIADAELAPFIRDVHAAIRATKPNLRLRINVVPRKGAYLPSDLFVSDPQLYLIVQSFLGNMDRRVAEDELVRDAVDHGVPAAKVSVMYGANISPGNGRPRVPSLPDVRYRGSIFSDDLLADGGYI